MVDTPETDEFDALRRRLTAVDKQLLHLAAERQTLVARIGERKRSAGRPTRDFQREREVIEFARSEAATLGLPADLAVSLMQRLIRASLVHQEKARVSATDHGAGRRALVIGGHGQMGRWFVDFLDSQGFAVEVADPAGGVPGHPHFTNWNESDLAHDLIVVATPLGVMSQVLLDLARVKPTGLIIDIASLKTPIRDALKTAIAAGCRVVSLHPMFGPDTELLSGRHVIYIDLGAPEAIKEAHALFESTMVETAEMDLDQHDRLIAFVLGLSHALNIAFFNALVESGESVPRLAEISSTTFDAQLEVASRVSGESPQVYFEIQALNAHGASALDALEHSLQRLRDVITDRNQDEFVRIMDRGRAYLQAKRPA